MARILAIDYGTKRTGLAVTDPMQIIATGLETVRTHLLFDYLKSYIQKEVVEGIVVGMPRKMDFTPSDTFAAVNSLIAKLKTTFPAIKIDSMDERMTSRMALQTMIDGGLPKMKRQNKALLDTISATLILQNYLEFIKR